MPSFGASKRTSLPFICSANVFYSVRLPLLSKWESRTSAKRVVAPAYSFSSLLFHREPDMSRIQFIYLYNDRKVL